MRSCNHEPKLFSKASWILVALYDADSGIENLREPIYRGMQDVLDILSKRNWSKNSKEKEFKKTLIALIKNKFIGINHTTPDKFTLTDIGRQVGKYHHYLVNNRNKIDLSDISVKDDYSQNSNMSMSVSGSMAGGDAFVSRNLIKDNGHNVQDNNSYYSYKSDTIDDHADSISQLRLRQSLDLDSLLNCGDLTKFIFDTDEPNRSKSISRSEAITPTIKAARSMSFSQMAGTQHSGLCYKKSILEKSCSSAGFDTNLRSASLIERKEKPPFRSLRDNIRVDPVVFKDHVLYKKDIKKCEVILLVDNREKKRQVETTVSGNYFREKLSSYGIRSETCNLPIGDFMWVIEITSKL